MQPYLMISSRTRDGDGLGDDVGTLAFYRADAGAAPAALGKISAWEKITRAAFIAQLKEIADGFPVVPDWQHEKQKHICLFVHGYNTTWQDALQDYLQVKNGLIEGADLGQAVLYSWPSKGSVAGYLPDREIARDSASDIAQLFVDLNDFLVKKQRVAAATNDPDKLCRAKISVIAHSMGNYVMQEALVAASKRLNDPQLISLINQFVMVAADVDNDLFQRDKPVDSDGSLMANLCYRIAALYTGLDSVLGVSAGLKHFGTRRLGRSGLADPLNVWDNVFEFDVTTFINTSGSIHSAVFDSAPAVAIVRNILRGIDRNYIANGVQPYTSAQNVAVPA
ncbi:MAG TPA: alpha/beta hydrolase [Rudaea sp.]